MLSGTATTGKFPVISRFLLALSSSTTNLLAKDERDCLPARDVDGRQVERFDGLGGLRAGWRRQSEQDGRGKDGH